MIISSKNIPIYKVAELDKATGKEVDKEIPKKLNTYDQAQNTIRSRRYP